MSWLRHRPARDSSSAAAAARGVMEGRQQRQPACSRSPPAGHAVQHAETEQSRTADTTADATASAQRTRGCLFPVLLPPQQQPQAQQPSSAACRAEPAQPLPGWQPRPTAPRERLTNTNRAGRQATHGTVQAGRQAASPVCSRRHSARQHQQGPAPHQAMETAPCAPLVTAMAEAQD